MTCLRHYLMSVLYNKRAPVEEREDVRMAEFHSKKLSMPVPEPSISPSIAENEQVGEWWIELAHHGVYYAIKTQELCQDFVTYGRSSRTKTMWTGIALMATVAFLVWLLTRKIRLLV